MLFKKKCRIILFSKDHWDIGKTDENFPKKLEKSEYATKRITFKN